MTVSNNVQVAAQYEPSLAQEAILKNNLYCCYYPPELAEAPDTAVGVLSEGSSIEDKLIALSDTLSSKLDATFAEFEAKGENFTATDLAKLQKAFMDIQQMQNTITNMLKKLDDTKSNIVSNIK
jgi:hypothetical protein